MWTDQITTAGAMPALEAMIRFASERHRVLAHNIANIDTPGFIPLEVSVRGFQEELGRAVDRRRKRNGGASGKLELRRTREIEPDERGGLEFHLKPRTASGNVLFHDRNNRDLERMMQDVAENVAVFRTASDLLKNQHDVMRAAIGLRP